MKIKYISNRELLAEIQRSKATFCYFVSPNYAIYDVIVGSLEDVTPEAVLAALARRKLDIERTDVVFRVMSDLHLPAEDDERRRRKSRNGEWIVKTNFPAFRHYIIRDGILMEVGRSHWRGDFDTGRFSASHGHITDRLARMFMLMVERYSRGGSWRGYSYNDEMRSHALVQLSQVGLQFDESRSENPFAFYTQIIKNSFRRILNLERRNQDIRDDLLMMSGAQPSYTRQIDNEFEQREEWQKPANEAPAEIKEKEPPKRRGRKPKVRVE